MTVSISNDARPRPSSAGLHRIVEISIVIPVRDEAESIAPLLAEIAPAMQGQSAYEIIVIDDASRDGSADIVLRAASQTPRLRLIQHTHALGQTAALRTGIVMARGDLIATLDGDGQNDPRDIPGLLEAYRTAEETCLIGMVAGERLTRHDTALRRGASRAANAMRRRVLHDAAVDSACGIKLIRRDAFLALPYFDHAHRFLPALMTMAGYDVRFIPVNHRPRHAGRSKYGIFDRLWVGIVDLFGVYWLRHRYNYFPDCAVERPKRPPQ